MILLVGKSKKSESLIGSRGGRVSRGAIDWSVALVGSAFVGEHGGSRSDGAESGGEPSGGGVGSGRGEGVSLLPMVSLEVVFERARLGPGVVAVRAFVGPLACMNS